MYKYMYNIIKKFNFPDEICSSIFYFYTISKHKKELETYFYNRDDYYFYIGRNNEIMSFINYKNNNYTNIIKTTIYLYNCYNMEERLREEYDDEEEEIEDVYERRINRLREEEYDEEDIAQIEYEEEQDRIQREYEEEIY